MDKQQAKNLIKQTFEKPFDKSRFTLFVKDLLNRMEEAPLTYQGKYIPESYKQYIASLKRIGKYTDGENKIDILVIKLRREISLERARSMQRNFVAWYLNGSRGGELKDAALASYISPNENDWRFSLVKMDYRFEETQNGKLKVKEDITPARRWSFLVGANENSHTAQSRLVNILADDEKAPTLSELEEAFNIETVTKEFFRKYRDLFRTVKEALDKVVKNDARIRDDFEKKGVNTVDFSKKLLGQIIFLYFLQKKGWFGVERNAEWGNGSKQFLRELFEKKFGDYVNFFNDILEPLFYEALRNDRSHEDHYYSRFNCKIPFLNGGLFDPIGNYDWVHTDIFLPDALFSNKNKTREGDIGDGILDIFDRYNFTVKEDEPLEKEVAIDPELLGKAYEKFNAIRLDNFEQYEKALKSGKKGDESKFNRQYGVYYTPREIVHYMCQQSLIAYLDTELSCKPVSYEMLGDSQLRLLGNEGKIGQLDIMIEHKSTLAITREDIEILIHMGERIREIEDLVERKGKETRTYSYKIPESVRRNASLIDQKLANITVCDPAVGSAAFPVGMMSEIVKARNALSTFMNDKARTPYKFKRRCIEHSLYGVDIDPGAVEIAKLRLWLSLIVDEEDIKHIKPLPNLDYKIVCGNSLLGYPYTPRGLEKIERLKEKFFQEVNPAKKNELRSEINDEIYGSFKDTEKTLGYKVTMDFKTNFSEVFHEKGGFDVVIGNPPYVQLQKDRGKLANLYNNCHFHTFTKTGDIYCLFYEKANQILKNGGLTCYITSNKWMRAGYGAKLRDYFSQHTQPLILIDVGPGIFESATVDTNILLFSKDKDIKPFIGCILQNGNESSLNDYVQKHSVDISVTENGEKWEIYSCLQQRLTKKIKKNAIPLENWNIQIYRGVTTGYNEAFVIDGMKRKELIAKDPKSAEIIKPLLRGRDIQRYKSKFDDFWLIFIPWHFPLNRDKSIQGASSIAENEFKKNFPSIYNYLQQYKLNLNQRNKDETGIRYEWYSLQRCAATYESEFVKEKIVWKRIGSIMRFGYDNTGAYCLDSTCIATGEKIKFLVGMLNSKLCLYELFRTSPKTGTGDQIISVQALEPLRIPKPDKYQELKITEMVDCILSYVDSEDYYQDNNKQRKVKECERKIDRFVYDLYGLTEKEIGIVEGEIAKKIKDHHD